MSKLQYIILTVAASIAALLPLLLPIPALFGTLIFLAFILVVGFPFGKYILEKEVWLWQLIFGTIFLISGITIFLSAVYWFYEINSIILGCSIIFASGISLVISDKKNNKPIRIHWPELNWQTVAGVCIAAEQLLLLGYIVSKRYSDTLISPWTIIESPFLFLFSLATFCLLWFLFRTKKPGFGLVLICLHFFIILGIGWIVFAHGFGFDPNIHQASERWILDHGVILPKQPYYIGQYMLVLLIHSLTHLPLTWIDNALVPVLTSIFLPLFAYFAFSRKGYNDFLLPAILFIPFLPLIFFIQTSPNNLALLLGALTIWWIWYEHRDASLKTHLFGLSLCILSVATHPFIGMPLLLVYGSSLLAHRLKKQSKQPPLSIVSMICIALSAPFLFALNSLRSGEHIGFQSPFITYPSFFSLFKKPFWYWIDEAPRAWQLFYQYKILIIPLVILCMTIGAWLLLSRYNEKKAWLGITSALGLFACAFLMATTIRFPGVIDYEQGVYAHRLLDFTLVALLPFFVFFLREVFLFFSKKPAWFAGLCLALSMGMSISVYFTYPTRDAVSRYSGYNVRDADIHAVQFIAEKNKDAKEYIVITNQVVAAAALKELGFAKYYTTTSGEHFFYSIPTGGPLYSYFEKMVYQKPKRQWMIDAMDFAGVKKAYFVHTNYWAPAAEIRDEAKKEADAWWEIDEGRVWVYEYTKY